MKAINHVRKILVSGLCNGLLLCGLLGGAAVWASDGPLVSTGYFHTCAIQNDKTVTCWGYDGNDRTIPPAGEFKQLAAGREFTCGLRLDDRLVCWGRNEEGQSNPPQDRFTQVSGGTHHACGITATGNILCWGDNSFQQLNSPSGTFSAISVGGFHACALDAQGNIQCWGLNDLGQTVAPQGKFVQISSGEHHSCGVHENGAAFCWGKNLNGQIEVSHGTFLQISSGAHHTCGLRTDFTVECWGRNDNGQSDPLSGSFIQISSGSFHGCGVRPEGTVECWGDDFDGASSPPSGEFLQISGGGTHVCGVDTDSAVRCWGLNYDGQSSPPTGTFQQVSSGGWFLEKAHTCGLRSNGSISCWGYDKFGQASPPAGTFKAVDSGVNHSCAIRDNGTLACWGDGSNGRASPPEGIYTQLSAGSSHSCAIRDDGTVRCWGANVDGVTDPPEGQFKQVSSGRFYSCGVRQDQTLHCWGRNTNNQASPPNGLFQSVATGWRHTCGLKLDGTIDCWGNNLYGQRLPPGGVFRAITTGEYNSCGIRSDDTVECWGFNGYNFDDVPTGLAVDAVLIDIPTLTFQESRLRNISTNGTANDFGMRAGFIVQGNTQRFVLMGENMQGMQNPLLSLYKYPSDELVYSNDDWQSDPSADQVVSNDRAPNDSRDAAFLITLEQGVYYAKLQDTNGSGRGLVSVTAVDETRFQETFPINLSTRGSSPLTAGLIVTGSASRCFVVKSEGPYLGNHAISDPALTLVNFQTGEIIDANNNWMDHPSAALVQASGFAPVNPKEAALAIRLHEGSYLVELYSVYEAELGQDSIVAVTELPEHLLQDMTCDYPKTPNPAPKIIVGNLEAHISQPAINKLSYYTGQAIPFDGEAITDNAGNVTYLWDFGSGAQLSGSSTTASKAGVVRYGSQGSRVIRLTTTVGSRSNTDEIVINVVERENGRK